MICSAVVALLFANAASSATEAPVGVEDTARQERLETFDAAWRIVRDSHFDPDMNGVDWEAVREEFRPNAAAATSIHELRSVINEMIRTLGQSHFQVIPREAAEALEPEDDQDDEATDGDADQREQGRSRAERDDADDDTGGVGIDFRIVDDAIVVTRIEPGSPADLAGVSTGWEIVAINGRELRGLAGVLPDEISQGMREIRVWQSINHRLTGRPGSTVTLTAADGDGTEHEFELVRTPIGGFPASLLDLEIFAVIDHERITTDEQLSVGIIRFNYWLPQFNAPIERAVNALRDCDGLILDLRGNVGGVGFTVSGVAGHFLEERLSLGTMRTRGAELNFRANPRRVTLDGEPVTPYARPLVVLTDPRSASTSEVFAGGMQAIERARVIGEPSAGAALPAMITVLPNGDRLMHAIADFVDADGRRLEAVGVTPDEVVHHTRAALLEGRDLQLEHAIRYIAQQTRNRQQEISRNPN